MLAMESIGAGDPVVFLHAAVCDRRMWRAQMAVVGTTHQAIAYDRRGFGETRAEAAVSYTHLTLPTICSV